MQHSSGIYTIAHFLREEECDALIARSEAIGYEEAKVAMDGGQKMMKMIRNNERILFTDENYAQELWLRLKPNIPQTIGNSVAAGLNELLRFYKYSQGQRFKMHRDGSFIRNEQEFSQLTFMVYLNDNFEGGATRFDNGVEIYPEKGLALLFVHHLRHEGTRVEQGYKYVLRSDVMYRLEEAY